MSAAQSSYQSITWILGNVFALAAWWVLSGVVAGVFFTTFGDQLAQFFGQSSRQLGRFDRWIGATVGAMCGGIGGRSVGRIHDFAGILGYVYLWCFVGMTAAVFFAPAQRRHRLERADDLDSPGSSLDRLAALFSTLGSPRRTLQGTTLGGLAGACYGAFTASVLPISTVDGPFDEQAEVQRVAVAAVAWAILGGFGGAIGAGHAGIGRGFLNMLTGMLVGSCIGGLLALVAPILDDAISGVLHGALGGAIFGLFFAQEHHRHYL